MEWVDPLPPQPTAEEYEAAGLTDLAAKAPRAKPGRKFIRRVDGTFNSQAWHASFDEAVRQAEKEIRDPGRIGTVWVRK